MKQSPAHIHPLDTDVLTFWQQYAFDQRAAFDAIAAYLA
jgi:hypothetical protein